MTAREAVLLLVSVGRFGCFDNRAASLQECGVFRRGLALFESFTSLLSLSASLREYDIFIRASTEGLVQALFEGLVFFLCSLVPDVCRYSFEDAVYLGRYRASLRDVMVCQTLCYFSSRMWFSYTQPLPSLRVRFILADIVPPFERRWSAKPRSTSLRECGLLLTPCYLSSRVWFLLNLFHLSSRAVVYNPLPALLESLAVLSLYLCRLSSRDFGWIPSQPTD
ncbi:hypothetical protein BO83DRAFT_134969 [Aspergillus eucalypticola CBS 122712]|uniref:Uncharacterized protein n=1 Tax=Aspergillus eucalypticola (strain CBS 122712 / IBT 29274) TaxID=1448314 RepID=A0A317W7W2_ASPEC|nr:uncharacterized protein BO83DRAFT_134969 [Aspergillus eucalypticola CBS 122712]PWY82736.1 hypothetical protein BO83DRAFT_134969 [Aspergillus eucalypticola CBS 122712]